MRLSPDALDYINGLVAWLTPLNDIDVWNEWLSQLMMTFNPISISRVHSLLRSDPQEHVVRIVLLNTGREWMTPFLREWEEWLEKHLTGSYNILVSNAGGQNKVIDVSFEKSKDAVLFKMFFG